MHDIQSSRIQIYIRKDFSPTDVLMKKEGQKARDTVPLKIFGFFKMHAVSLTPHEGKFFEK
jgi:hypothetical protein